MKRAAIVLIVIIGLLFESWLYSQEENGKVKGGFKECIRNIYYYKPREIVTKIKKNDIYLFNDNGNKIKSINFVGDSLDFDTHKKMEYVK
jgi:hypothetical protein